MSRSGALVWIAAIAFALAAIVRICLGVEYRELLTEEKALEGATHVVTVFADDLTNNVAGATQLISVVSLPAENAMRLISMKLIVPFTETNLPTIVTNMVVSVGDGTDPNLFLYSSHIAASSVWVTGISVGTGSQKVYSAADTVDIRFCPGNTNTLAEWDAGEVKFYFRRISRFAW